MNICIFNLRQLGKTRLRQVLLQEVKICKLYIIILNIPQLYNNVKLCWYIGQRMQLFLYVMISKTLSSSSQLSRRAWDAISTQSSAQQQTAWRIQLCPSVQLIFERSNAAMIFFPFEMMQILNFVIKRNGYHSKHIYIGR